MIKQYFIHVGLPLFLATLIYILFRADTLFLFTWLDELGLKTLVNAVRQPFVGLSNHIPQILLYSFPDAAWSYAFTALMTLYWRDDPSTVKWIWIAFAAMMGVASELGQLFGVLNGTFDLVDLIAYIVAPIAALYCCVSIKQPSLFLKGKKNS